MDWEGVQGICDYVVFFWCLLTYKTIIIDLQKDFIVRTNKKM